MILQTVKHVIQETLYKMELVISVQQDLVIVLHAIQQHVPYVPVELF